MMQPSDVTDGMMDAYLAPYAYTTGNADPDELRHVKRDIAAALTAMPDDLLRKLVAERGFVMVPRDDAKILVQTALDSGYAMDDVEICGATNRTHELLFASDPLQQAQDDGKEGV